MENVLTSLGYTRDDETGVWRRRDFSGIAYSDGDEAEERIAAAVADVDDLSTLSQDFVRHQTDWASIYHLSSSRANLLRPFVADLAGEVLEIGAGCGALTRFIGECGGKVLALEGSLRRAGIARRRTHDLDNVAVVCEDFGQFMPERQFDVVTLVGVLEYANLFTDDDNPALAMLKQIRALVKPQGKLILAIENQLGLKYFAGAPEDHIGQPMYGLEGRYHKTQPKTFGKKILSDMLLDAGFSGIEVMSPLPDYKLPISIVTEAGFAHPDFDAAALVKQSVPFDPQLPEIAVFSPELVWPAVIENGLFMDMANSFLIVASPRKRRADSDTLGFHFSTSRRPQFCKQTDFRISRNEGIKAYYKWLSDPSGKDDSSDGPLEIKRRSQAAYEKGRTLLDEISEIVTRDGWSFEETSGFIDRYVDILNFEHLDSKGYEMKRSVNFEIPGYFFDIVPQNIIVRDNGHFAVIDQEWRSCEKIELGQLLFRALQLLLVSVSRFGDNADGLPLTRKDFVLKSLAGAGYSISEEDMSRYLEAGSRAHHQVTGRPASDYFHWAPERLLSTARWSSISAGTRQHSEDSGAQDRVDELSGELLHERAQHVDLIRQISELELKVGEKEERIGFLLQAGRDTDSLLEAQREIAASSAANIAQLETAVKEGRHTMERLLADVAAILSHMPPAHSKMNRSVLSPMGELRRLLIWTRMIQGTKITPSLPHQMSLVEDDATLARWEMTGNDPNFELYRSASRLLPRGVYRLSFDAPVGWAHLRNPKLFIDTGSGYNEGEATLLKPAGAGEKRFLAEFRLWKPAIGLRFDPSEQPGALEIVRPMLRLMTRGEYYARAAVRVARHIRGRGASIPGLFARGMRSLGSRGVTGTLAAIRSSMDRIQSGDLANDTARARRYQHSVARYVEISDGPPLQNPPVSLICFYLPQFHPVRQNDEWWGEGFTEWTNVRPAQPQFEGHYQPRIPDSLGYYDLRDVNVQRSQIDLAKLYGIGGFCFYFYWFSGERLLETPIQNYLENPDLDFPFCLCWANENWSRRWDGKESEILIAQDHSPEDDIAFISYLSRYLSDPRYIRVEGKPLLLVYRPNLLPNAVETAARWRKWCRENEIGEIYLAYTQSFEMTDPEEYGFDAAVEFPPNNSAPHSVTDSVVPLREDFASNVFDWSVLVERSRTYATPRYPLFRGVCPAWDNTARRKNKGTVFVNNTPALYREWLSNAIGDTLARFERRDQRLIFVNAWNEWAEGAYLEPDSVNGFAYLEATRKALTTASAVGNKKIVMVSHDAHPHGAQYLAAAMAETLVNDLGYEVHIILLGDGQLRDRFAHVATIHRFDEAALDRSDIETVLSVLRAGGAEIAIVNTTVSGGMAPYLKAAGFRVVSLIHELPGILAARNLSGPAAAIVDHSDLVVFPAELVQKGFESFVGRALENTYIRPQGVLKRNPFKGRRAEARSKVCKRHGFALGSKFAVSVGFADHRKGYDLFIEIAEKIVRTDPDMNFVWIGHFDEGVEEKISALLKKKRLADRVKFIGFVNSPMEYYAGASVYLLTSREDPFPNVVIDAADVGTPIVAFEGVTGASDFILERNGALAKAFDKDDFAQHIRVLAEREESHIPTQVDTLRRYLLDLLHRVGCLERVSVVVPNFNYAHHIVQRLETVARQTYPIYELIVLDDASRDQSVETIRTFLSISTLDYTLIVNDTNSGSVFRQWTAGVERCQGDLVWIAEADDFCEETFLEQLVPAFEDESTVLAYSQSRQVDGNDVVLAEDYLSYTSDIGDDWVTDYARSGTEEIARALAVKNTIPNVSAVVFRRGALTDTLTRLNADLSRFKIAGDWMVYIDILRKGNIRFVAKSLNSHRRHTASVTKAEAAQKHYEEIYSTQKVARSVAPITEETERVAEAWRSHVRQYLGLDRS